MSGGAGGFAYAPVTKGILLSSIGASIISQAARASHRPLPAPLAAAAHVLVFRTPGELLFGSLLLYYFRIFERQWGSKKYGAYALAVTGLSYALHFSLLRLQQWGGVGHSGAAAAAGDAGMSLPSGPLPLVVASFMPFLLDVPYTSSFSVLGARLTDKAFVYLAGVQLLVSSGRRSALLGGCALLAGLAYRLNLLGLKRVKLPGAVVRVFTTVIGPLVAEGRGGATVVLASPAGGVAAHARGFGGVPAAAAAGASGAAQPFQLNPEAMESLMSMGFDRTRAASALQQANNDLQTAIALLL